MEDRGEGFITVKLEFKKFQIFGLETLKFKMASLERKYYSIDLGLESKT